MGVVSKNAVLSDICDFVSSIVLVCFFFPHKNKNFGAYTQIMDTIRFFHSLGTYLLIYRGQDIKRKQ